MGSLDRKQKGEEQFTNVYKDIIILI
jgi:hypothetical protein